MHFKGMWSGKTPQDASIPSETRLADLEARCATLERQEKNLRLEWEDTFERVHRALQRLNKRHRDQEKRDTKEPEAPNPSNGLAAKRLTRRGLHGRR